MPEDRLGPGFCACVKAWLEDREMDYDKTRIAQDYDAARTIPAARLKVWEDRFRAHVPTARDILDLGCGTGRFSQMLADLYGARVIGVDPSETMLAQARRKAPGLTFLVGAGERLPLEDASIDLVFISLVYHHLADPAQTARACFRVLRRGGAVIIRTPTIDANGYFAFDKFFPSYKALAHRTMPRRTGVNTAFEGAGFVRGPREVIRHQTADDWDDFARKATLRADSFLARLPDEEFNAGLSAIERYIATGAGPIEPLTEPIDLFVFRSFKAEQGDFPELAHADRQGA